MAAIPRAGEGSKPVKRARLQDGDLYTLSLPSHDKPSYYDPSSDSDDSDGSNPPPPITTNRGHKLSAAAQHVRRGRLGAFPNLDAGFSSHSANKRQRTLAGEVDSRHGFAVAPNLHLLPRDLDIEDRPTPAHLPPASQTPLDLLLNRGLQATLGPKNRTFMTLALSATGLIEQEGPLIGALSRVCAGLRGEGYEWRWKGDDEKKDARNEERKREVEADRRKEDQLDEEDRVADEQADQQRQQDEAEQAERDRLDAAAAAAIVDEKPDTIAAADQVEMPRAPAPTPAEPVTAAPDAMDVDAPVQPVEVAATPAEAAPTAVDPAADVPAPSEPVPEAAEATADTVPAAAAQATTVNGNGPAPAAGGASAAQTGPPPLPSMALPPTPPAEAHDSTENATPQPEPTTNGVLPTGENAPVTPGNVPTSPPQEEAGVEAVAGPEVEGEDGDDEMDGEAEEEEAPRRSGRRVAPRMLDASLLQDSIDSETESEQQFVTPRRPARRGPAVADEELPEYARRLIDPEVYVRSLFVSDKSVDMPAPAAPGMAAGTMDTLSPNEQEVMVHDCLT